MKTFFTLIRIFREINLENIFSNLLADINHKCRNCFFYSKIRKSHRLLDPDYTTNDPIITAG